MKISILTLDLSNDGYAQTLLCGATADDGAAEKWLNNNRTLRLWVRYARIYRTVRPQSQAEISIGERARSRLNRLLAGTLVPYAGDDWWKNDTIKFRVVAAEEWQPS